MPDGDEAQHISTRDARGADVVLNTPMRRGIFLIGLAIVVLLAIIATLTMP